MIKLLSRVIGLSFLLLTANFAHAGIVFDFGSNVNAERQAALEAAKAEIEQIIDFKQDVKISLSFTNLDCDLSSAVLGAAGPQNAYRDFPGAPQSNVWYVSAQAADLGSTFAMEDTSHIGANFNHRLGASDCLPGVTWYFGTDHNPGFNQIDFLSTAVHEFMHGLGFLSFVGSNGVLLDGRMDNYSTFLVNNSTSKSWSIMTNGERATSILNNNNLIWNGAKTTSMISLLQAGTTGGKARLFAPSVYEGGSSTSHFDVSLLYDTNAHEVMEPYAESPEQSILASAAFCDMGWDLLRDTDGDTENDCDDATPLVLDDADGDGMADAMDAFPNDPTETVDSDNDGTGNNADTDDDNDTVLDVVDNCPFVSNTNQLDYDTDGTGNACGDDVPMPGVSGAVSLDKVGASVAFAGDVDDDGYGDYVVGMPGYDIPPDSPKKAVKDAGRAVVISGKTGLELMSMNGVAAKDAFGTAVAGGADVDDDGFDDVLVGAPKADDAMNSLVDAGSVTVLYGPDATRSTTFFGEKAKSLAGSAVALGDVNDDGFADMIIGAPKDDNATLMFTNIVDAGSVIVRSGDPGSGNAKLVTFYGALASVYAGSALAVGNVDAVAGADIIVGAPNDDFVPMGLKDVGSVTVHSFYSAEAIIPKKYGAVSKAYLGRSVAGGDVNDDGRDDVLAGAPGDDNGLLKDTGSVIVLSGVDGSQLAKKSSAVAKAALGNSVAAGDVDGDGFADIIAGAWKDDKQAEKLVKDAGSVSVWSGDGYSLIDTLYGDASKDYFGSALGAGDINSDGKADLVIGIAGDDIPATKTLKDAGTVQIVSGADVL
jgi:hypothetical protein